MPSMTTARQAGGTLNGHLLTGAVRDVYSMEILYHAQPKLVYTQFVDVRTELGKEAGDTIKFVKYNDLHGNSLLSEVEVIKTTHLSASLIAIEVAEHGFAVKESERLIRTSWDDVVARATMLLGQHYGRTVDGLCRNEFRAAGSQQSVIVGGGANRSALAVGDTLDVQSIKDGAEILATNKVVKIGGAYVCIVHPHQARGMRDDNEWLEAHKYASPQQIFMGEIGMIEGVRFIETTNTAVIKAVTGAVYVDGEDTDEVAPVVNADVDAYQAQMIGGHGVGWANALPVQLRDNGIEDFGRNRSLAWYSIMGAGTIDADTVVQIETA